MACVQKRPHGTSMAKVSDFCWLEIANALPNFHDCLELPSTRIF